MALKDALSFRRSIRHYDEVPVDPGRVEQCLRLAQLAPSSSNMQLYEFIHVVDPHLVTRLAEACLGQRAATTANQLVVFVTRQDLHRAHAAQVLDFERGNIRRNSPAEKVAKHTRHREIYYGRLMPFIYARAWGLLGLVRKAVAVLASLRRPMLTRVSEADMRVVVHKSCALAAQTFLLAMAEEGIDTCPLEGFDERRVKRILRLPRGAEVSLIVSCGMRKPGRGLWGERYRLPFDQVYRRI